jgi:phage-related minor tail protein
MSTTSVAIRLGVEGKADVKRAFDEVGKAGESAFRGVAGAMDAAGSAADRETQRLTRLAQAARQAAAADQAQRNFNTVLGVGLAPARSARDSAEVFESTARAAEDLEVRTAALRAQIDPLGTAQKKLNAELAEADELFKVGAITQKEHGVAVALAKERFDLTARSLKQLGGDANLTGSQLRALVGSFQLLTHAASAGEVPLGALAVQSLRLGKAFGAGSDGIAGTLSGIGRVLGSLITPTVLVSAAIGGIGLAAATAYNKWIVGQKQVETALKGGGRAAGATADDINRIGAAGAAAGRISTAAAREIEIALLHTGKIGAENFTGLIAIAKDYATTVGSDAATATKELADAFADPVKGADSLNAKLGFLDERTRQYIRRLAEQNDRTATQRALLDAMRPSLANAEAATTALGRAWDYVKRAASAGGEAVGRAIDRASGGGTPQEQLDRTIRQITALSHGGGAPSRVIADLERQADALREKIAQARHEVDAGRIEAEARELSLKVGEAVRKVVPGTETIQQLEALRSSLGRLLEDPLAAKHVGNLSDVENAYRRVSQALSTYSGENARFLDPQARKLRLQQIEIELINATTPAQKAALEAERARIELIGQTVTPEQAALAVEQARARVFAESSKYIRDYARDQQFSIEQTKAEIAFVGRSVEEKEKFIARLKAEQDLRRQGISAASAEGQLILANAERQAVLNAQLERARTLQQDWMGVFDSSMNRFADLLAEGKLDWKSWADAGRAALADIKKEILKLAILNPLKNALFGSNLPTLSSTGGILGSILSVFRFHEGGIVGFAGAPAFAPAAVFRNAPRFHSGAFLSPDEVPAILQRGERVLSRNEVRSYDRRGITPAPIVNVTIQTPSPAAFQASRTQIAADLARAVRLGTRGM